MLRPGHIGKNMADDVYRRGTICKLSRHDCNTLRSSNLLFTECMISTSDNDSTFVNSPGERFAVAVKTSLEGSDLQGDLILNVRSSDKEVQQSEGNLKVFLSENVLKSRDLCVGKTVWVKKVNPIPLQRVVVGVSSEETYLWAQSSLASFLLKSLSSGPITVRENDILYLHNDQVTGDKEESSEVLILQNEPVSQGCVTSETCLVITKLEKTEIQPASEISETESLVLLSDSLKTFLVSDFTHNLITQGQLCDHDQPNEKTSQDKTHQFRVSVFNSDKINYVDLCQGVSSRVYVSVETLIDLCLFNGSWVKIYRDSTDLHVHDKQEEQDSESMTISQQKYCGERFYTKIKYHLVQLVAVDDKSTTNISSLINSDEVEDRVLYIAPLLYFNLFGKITPNVNDHPPVYISPNFNAKTLANEESNTESTSGKPPFATEAHIALIHSPYYKVGESFDGALMSYFKVPRILTVGDVFFVYHDWQRNTDAQKMARTGDDQWERDLVVFFKVTRLVCGSSEANSCFVDVEHTSLYQRGSVHSYVPYALTSSIGQGKLSFDLRPSYWEQIGPAGLRTYTDILEDLVKPYLHSSDKKPLSPFRILLSGPPGVGKRTVARATSRKLNMHFLGVSCYELIGESVAATEARLKNLFQKAVLSSPCIMLLQNIHALGKDREGNEDEPRIAATLMNCINNLKDNTDWPVVVIATSSLPNDITSDMYSCFLHEVKLEAPTESERYDILCGLGGMACVGNDVSFEQLAKRTAGLVLADFVALFSYASRAATRRLLNGYSTAGNHGQTWFSWQQEQELSSMGIKLCNQDFEDSLEVLQSSMSDAIGAPKIPSVKWEDVGGLAEVKAAILDTVQLPLQHPELFAAGLRRSGVLLYGPPGTGKTLLAKAVATECSLNFLSVKGPELINMYVGQSEQNVREVFTRAQSARPCVIFFDELDSLAPNRGRSGDSGGVMDRVVSQLLAELDGLHKACDVFVIGATNRPDLLDPALLRPGRFDKLLYLGVSEDRESQLNILRALTRKFCLDPDLRLEKVASLCPTNLTGADFYALCSDAMLQSVKRKIEILEQGNSSPDDCGEIQVTEADFQKALDALVPSVSLQELKRYKDLQNQFTMDNSHNTKK